MTRSWRWLGVLGGLVSPLLALAAPTSDPFLQAQEAFSAGNGPKFEAAAKKIGHSPLQPYVEYYRWRMRLEQTGDADTDTLIAKNAGDYLAQAYRADWLKHLARNERWEAFERYFPTLDEPDGELRCLAVEGRKQRDDHRLRRDLQALWRALDELPSACERIFDEAFRASLLTEDDVWARARLQFSAGRYALARTTLRLLPGPALVDDRVWSALNNKTAGFLDSLADNAEPGRRSRELAALGLLRLARQSPLDAVERLKRLESWYAAPERARFWAVLATWGAIEHRPEAMAWFERAGPGPLDDEQHRWKVRVALRAGDWPRVRAAILAMPKALADEPAWIYWLGRAVQAAGDDEASVLMWNRIAEQTNFYGLLAAEELGRRFRLPPRPPFPSGEEIAAVAKLGAIQRAVALLKLDLRTEGVREWAWAMRGLSDRQLLAAAEFAQRQHLYDRAINAAEKTQHEHDYHVRYLTPYREEVRRAAGKNLLDDAWIYGLIRQESRFVAGIKSSAGAQGLMQLMPATARWVAKQSRMSTFRPARVTDVDTNVMLGTTYLGKVFENLDRHPAMASAAYNAGPGRASKWRDPQRSLEGAVYAETIPFTETRDYVKKVLANAVIYTNILSGTPDSLKARLGVVESAAVAAAPNKDLP